MASAGKMIEDALKSLSSAKMEFEDAVSMGISTRDKDIMADIEEIKRVASEIDDLAEQIISRVEGDRT